MLVILAKKLIVFSRADSLDKRAGSRPRCRSDDFQAFIGKSLTARPSRPGIVIATIAMPPEIVLRPLSLILGRSRAYQIILSTVKYPFLLKEWWLFPLPQPTAGQTNPLVILGDTPDTCPDRTSCANFHHYYYHFHYGYSNSNNSNSNYSHTVIF
ncbi:hypothetical protein PAAG_12228 [Paracoccidioides lutzii Pb01]|uniref:Uncharacterized protein n=1 Tax=Paracoccidioides lutzii (strain ATCC MYA-826 / Pb01) TaxID=502779 RepID=A0A0A2V4P0_PARBA|nr:hypothetical protein PAAG_12228 [Paracoccidioides lutzii Pb01]KGQ01100.1 hypothetical protein PAAG_12228 [Paracoccidioides lutzii Pb01]